jgi:invasion protein IalB
MTIQQKDQSGPIAKIALGHAAPDQPLRAMVLLPTNVSFPSSVKIFADDKDAWGLDFAWVRCIQGGCFAEAVPSEDDLRRWRGQEASGRMVFKDAAGREIAIPVSFRGLGQSLDALMK